MITSDYKTLVVWQKSMDLVVDVYQLLKSFPSEEKFAICDQIRRCAISVPSNIAEGQARDFAKEFSRFISIARGSLAELETQLILSFRLGYIAETTLVVFSNRITEISKMLFSLKSKLTTKNS